MNKQLLGTVGVDAGCLWLVDPCYILNTRGLDRDGVQPAALEKTWAEHCTALTPILDTGKQGGEFEKGVVFSTGYGDGEYPGVR